MKVVRKVEVFHSLKRSHFFRNGIFKFKILSKNDNFNKNINIQSKTGL